MENSPRIPFHINPKKNEEIKKIKNYKKEKIQKLEILNDSEIKKGFNHNSSYNQKKPRAIKTDNNEDKKNSDKWLKKNNNKEKVKRT